MLGLPCTVALDREKIDSKCDLEKRTALVTEEATIYDSRPYGLVWSKKSSTLKKDEEDAKKEDEATMSVFANELEEGDDVAHHISCVLSNMCMEHKKASFVCFQIAVKGSQKDICIKSAKKASKSFIAGKTKKNAAFTTGRCNSINEFVRVPSFHF